MNNLTELEVENLRHLIGEHSLITKKLEFYAQNCQDPELQSIFQRDAQAAKENQQQLLTFL
ncbi:hypothetical protein [Sporosarcina sp. Marseille-Q4943]|uniref:hypothetical protein n=1 Tax=Sporosarcina sp. Marseille-Q4943 TaxID=2942204 RepID=UPI00208DD08E|nr:hypothetical protein [Sporosarcina sp. Marseille-Q4943]